ncbi:hypothetical protein Pint_23505 [Pistacia integerrima]|uniref:Uncharacterized protein n=1 Tax=Pistacia integerrima TaxID=434235 RepID=A0ACC0YKJ1_9ROSI|nr:hypothetical protein Pint_23505 [Pistacia integerrima]
MCGIALIISGVVIDLSSIFVDATSPKSHQEELVFSVDDLKATLRRRGPDSLGCKKVFLYSNTSTSLQEQELVSVTEDCISTSVNYRVELLFIGATLQLRGLNPIRQPLQDSSINILVYNGEIFGGIHVESDSNDAEVLMRTLGQCCSCNSNREATCLCKGSGRCSVMDVLSAIKGPWALIYWQVI